jgi:hypothetical protein
VESCGVEMWRCAPPPPKPLTPPPTSIESMKNDQNSEYLCKFENKIKVTQKPYSLAHTDLIYAKTGRKMLMHPDLLGILPMKYPPW